MTKNIFFRAAQLIGRHCKLKGEIGSRSLVIATFFSQFTFRFIEWRIERTPHNFFCSLIFFLLFQMFFFTNIYLKKFVRTYNIVKLNLPLLLGGIYTLDLFEIIFH